MKKIFRIIIIALLIPMITVCAWLLAIDGATFLGNKQNETSYQVDNLPKDVTITYIGDSLTNGYKSDGGLKLGDYGYRSLVNTPLNATEHNFAVGGYTSYDVLDQLNSNTTINQVNEIITDKEPNIEDMGMYDQQAIDLSLDDSISESDYVIATIGANDILGELLTFNDDGSFTVNYNDFFDIVKSIQNRKQEIYRKIYEINPDIEIIDVGMYFAYPSFGDGYMRMLYPVLMLVEHYVFSDMKDYNVHSVTVRDNMQTDIHNYIDNPNDIHPNTQGYTIFANEILKEIQRSKV